MIVAGPCNGLVVLGTIGPRPPLALGEGHATLDDHGIPTLLTLLNRTLPVKKTSVLYSTLQSLMIVKLKTEVLATAMTTGVSNTAPQTMYV